MTIDDPAQNQQLLLPAPLTFFHAKIPFKHWQLRSLLCSPAPNTLYYPTDNNVFSLNPETRKREIVATLPFGPRCIGAKYGWVCAGGVENGQFASIRVRQQEKSSDQRRGDGDVEEGEEARESTSGSQRRISPEIKISQLGGLIVNSVTLHRPPSSKSDDDVLAVLTNNDRTVRIFHLAQNKVLTTLHLNIATNHASISPDGQHLVVVGDSEKVYFYHPASPAGSCPGTPGTGIGEAGAESWVLSSHPPLTAGTDALISTSFSPSSILCAVASQDGSITIFDTRYLCPNTYPGGPSPIVKRIPSSRPKTYAGAVRSVQFSPAPWDLLVWAEHSGRICIADARSNFTKRQVVDILVEKDDLIEAEIQSVEGDDTPRWRGREGTSSRRTTGDEEAVEEDSVTATAGDDDVHAFLSRRFDELSELVSRVRGNSHEWWATPALNNAPSHATPARAPTSPYTPAYSLTRTTTAPQPSQPVTTTQSPTASVTSTTPALLRDYRERQLERERQFERERAMRRNYDPPRRRNSTHPSYTDQSTATSTPPVQQYPIPPLPTPLAYPPATDMSGAPQRLTWSPTETPRTSRPIEASQADHQRNREQLNLLIAEERRQSYLRRRAASSNAAAGIVDDAGIGHRDDGDGVDITGCTLSRDGSKLYVATDTGIVEYHVDIAGRKVFPSCAPR